jgi:adenine/guanine phosphoribosyltransferase-like PRPP-binding protein
MGLDYARRVARDLARVTRHGAVAQVLVRRGAERAGGVLDQPRPGKRLYLDPALLEPGGGQTVVLVDDVINTGASALAAIRLLQKAGAPWLAWSSR